MKRMICAACVLMMAFIPAPVQAEDGRSDLRPGQTGPVQQPPVGPLGLHGECQQQVLRADAGVPQPGG